MAFLLSDRKILNKKGDELKEVENPDDAFKGNDVIAYYFGAKWCSDCVKFTSILKDFYDAAKRNKESFEIVYISSDKSEEEMNEFVLGDHGDWLVLYMDESDPKDKGFQTMWDFRDLFAITGIPSLIVTRKGDEQVCSMNGVTDVLKMGMETLNDWKQRNEELVLDFEKENEPERRGEEIVPNCCQISRFKPWVSSPPTEILLGKTLLRRTDEGFREIPSSIALQNAQLVGFFFSASWCAESYEFTHELRKFYEELTIEEKPFEIVFVSSEETEDMKALMEEIHGNWLATECDNVTEEKLSTLFGIQLFPTLRIVNDNGEIVSRNGVRDVRIKGPSAFDLWLSGAPATTPQDEKVFLERIKNQNNEQKKEL